MKLRTRLRRLFETLTGTYVVGDLPRGSDLAHDLATALPRFRAQTVFDVGANTGASAARFGALFPQAEIYCFEPVSESYGQLVQSTSSSPRVQCYNMAFSSRESRGTISAHGTAPTNRLSVAPDGASRTATGPTENVEIVTLDGFCRSEGIEGISYLKIDTEGNDLAVLEGAATTLSDQRVDLVEVEAGMNPSNQLHVPFEALKGFLERHDYALFAIYVQFPEQFSGEVHLRRTNPVFISRRMIEVHRTPPDRAAP